MGLTTNKGSRPPNHGGARREWGPALSHHGSVSRASRQRASFVMQNIQKRASIQRRMRSSTMARGVAYFSRERAISLSRRR